MASKYLLNKWMKNQLNIFPLQPTLSEFPILANGIIYLVVIARDLEITPGSSFFFISPLRQTSDPAGFYFLHLLLPLLRSPSHPFWTTYRKPLGTSISVSSFAPTLSFLHIALRMNLWIWPGQGQVQTSSWSGSCPPPRPGVCDHSLHISVLSCSFSENEQP